MRISKITLNSDIIMEEIKELLNQHFLEIKEYHTMIIILVNCCVVVFTGILGFVFNGKLEKIKKQQGLLLKKSEKYHELQLQSIKNIYPKIIKLNMCSEDMTFPLINESSDIKHRILNWIGAYKDLSECFSENDLFFNNEISNIISKYLGIHKKLFFDFTSNIKAIEEYRTEYKSESPDTTVLQYTREQLKESSDQLTKTKQEFKTENSDVIEFLKRKFKEIMDPEMK